jgi:cellulose synthase/poly-beta-1,6-N-acetylglucosamine synthase-like glycosyltransferase
MHIKIDLIANKNQVSTSSISFWQQIQEDWIAHGRDWSKPGFRAVAVHRFGVWRMKIQPKLLRAPFSILYQMLFRKIRNTYGEVVIGSTLEKLTPALKKQDRLLVVADNCNDATAEIARARGATVIERHDIERKGKGYALDYGLQFIESDPPDVVVIIDADCTVYEDAIALMQPIQATYLMIRPKNSQSSKDFVSQFSQHHG